MRWNQSLIALVTLLLLSGLSITVWQWQRRSLASATLDCTAADLAPLTVTPPLHQPTDPKTWLNRDRPLRELLPTAINSSQTSILIEKSKYRLTLYYNQQSIKSYPVVFGDPVGDKLREGDRKTPEGIFKLRDLYPHPEWSKFLWIDYPNATSRQKHCQARSQGTIPPNVGIGGEVGIHGVPAGRDAWIDQRVNWTLGCPALKNQDVDEIYAVVQVGTTVEIVP